jgi:predicted metal-binding membrane protein
MTPAGTMQAMAGMAPMSAGVAPWSLAYLGPSFAMWAIMMVAMMLPSAAPMILLYASFARRAPASARVATIAFTLIYLLLWAGFAGLATAGQAFLIAHGLLARASLAISDRTLVAVLLAAVALYQLSGLKRLCLSHCRSPVGFLMRHWRPHVSGAVRMGVAHGLYCLGCCSLLMLLLFAGGVMNLLWVAILTLVVLVEKYAPREWHMDWLVAAALLVTSCALLVR